MAHSYSTLLAAVVLLAGRPALAQTNDTIPVDKHVYSLFHPTPRRYMRPLVPDRPGITESPYTVDAGHFQLESDALRLLNSREGESHDRQLYLNHVLLKMGLSNQTDLQVGLNSYTITKHWDTPEVTPERHARFGDVSVRLKRNLIGDDNKAFALAAIAYAQFPTGRSVGEGGTEVGLIVPGIYKLSSKWNVGGQLQAEWSYEQKTPAHFLLLVPTATIECTFSSWLEGFAELVGYWDTRRAAWRSSINLGPQFDVSQNLQLDFGTHVALNRQTDHQYFVGFSFRH